MHYANGKSSQVTTISLNRIHNAWDKSSPYSEILFQHVNFILETRIQSSTGMDQVNK